MKNIISLMILTMLGSGCSLFLPHKQDVIQGNVFTATEVNELKLGMSEERVREIMGEPVSVTIFNDHRLNYIYTDQKGYSKVTMKRVICLFENGRLAEITHN